MSHPLIEIEDLCHADRLRGVTLQIHGGEFVAVMGPNGSGKSTLVKHLNALLLPTSGVVRVEGMDTSDPRHLWQIRERVGMVFQNPDHQMVSPVLEEEVAFGPENLSVPPALIRERVEQAMAALELAPHRLSNPAHLSGGQKQRVAIAAILAMRPSIMVLDEPTSMLDARGREETMQAIQRLRREDGLTVVLVTHSVQEAMQADRVVILEEGRIAAQGRLADVLPGLGAGYLDLPDSALLGQLLAEKGLMLEGSLAADAEFLARQISPLLDAEAVDEVPPPPPPHSPLLSVEDVGFTYLLGTPLQQTALSKVTLDIGEGETVALMGATGSGKSTLAQHLNALLRPTAGRVLLRGRDVGEDISGLRRQVALLFQYAEHQLFEDTVARDVAYGPTNLRLPPAEVERRSRDAMAAVGLNYDSYRDRSPFALSGGEMRKVALAGVLAMEPSILVLDEPTAGLDAAGKRQLLGILRDLRQRRGISLVVVSHDIGLVAELADRLVVLQEGRVVADGALAEVLDSPPAGVERPLALEISRRLWRQRPAVVRIADLASRIVRAWRVGQKNAESL